MREHDETTRVDGRPAKWMIAVTLSIIWVFAVYLAYYTVHKPFTAQIILSILDRAADLAMWVMLLLLAAAVGRRLLEPRNQTLPLEALLFSVALGLGILSLCTLFLGSIGMLKRWLFWSLFVGLLVVHTKDLRAVLRTLREARVSRPTSRLSVLLTAFLCLTFFFALAAALTPPAEWDALVYHLTGPKTYIDEGRLLYVPDNFHLNFPALTEMLFTFSMLLKGDILARLIHLAFGALTALAIYCFSRKYFAGRVPLLASVLFASIPTAVTIASWAYVDLTLTFYAFMAFFALVNWFDDTTEKRWIVLAGVFGGMAMSVKYTGVTVLMVASALMLYALVKKRTQYRRYFIALASMVLIAIAVAAPWYVKNAAFTGNPIYPYVFGGRDWDDLRDQSLASIGVNMSPLDLLRLPWDMTVLGTQGTQAFDATVSPYILAFLPLILFVRRDHRMVAPLSIFAVTTYILWIAAGAATYSTFVLRTRILLPCFAPLSILTAYVVENLSQLDRKAFSVQRFVLMALALGLSANVMSQGLTFLVHDPLPFIVGMESKDDYLRRQLADGHYDILDLINGELAGSAQVLFFWEPRSYYCEDRCRPDVVFDHFSQLAAAHGDADAIAVALQREHISHILVNQRWLRLQSDSPPFTAQHRQLFNQFRDRYLEPVHVDPGLYAIYEIHYQER